MTKELAKTITTALVQFIDRERPEGSLCCSSYECEKIEKAFEGGTYDVVEKLIKKKLLDMTEFEYQVKLCMLAGDAPITNELVKEWAKKLLNLAKKELLSYADESNPAIEAMADLERTYFSNPDKLPKWLKDDIARKELNAHTKGYNKGYKDASEEYRKCESYHFPTVTVRPLCWEPGGTCTNPQMDCINCPRKTAGRMFNTSSGTSTLKAEG